MSTRRELFQACQHDNLERMAALITDVQLLACRTDAYHYNNNLLHVSCEYGSLNCVILLLSKAEHLCLQKNYFGNFPLHVACSMGNTSCAEELLKCESMRGKVDLAGYDDRTALHIAAMQDHTELLVLLLRNNADSNARDRYGQAPLHMVSTIECAATLIINGDADIDATDKYGRTFMHYCCAAGNYLFLEFLLQINGDICCKDALGRAPLHIACCYANQRCIDMIIKCDAVSIDDQDVYGWTPLHLTVRQMNYIGSISLLRAGANPNIKDNLLRTALHFACRNTPLQLLVCDLITHGADVNSCTRDRQTPLHYACSILAEDNPVVSTLIANGANPGATDYALNTPLHLAVKFKQVKTVHRILKILAGPSYASDAIETLLKSGFAYILSLTLFQDDIPRVQTDVITCILTNKDITGCTPLQTCCHLNANNGYYDIAVALLL